MTNVLNLTWRDVLDSYAPSRPHSAHVDKYLPLVDSVGYDYFNWNGLVYKLIRFNGGLSYLDTGINVEELNDVDSE
jgi:hypothetical protein